MKRIFGLAVVMVTLATVAVAQPPEGRPGQGRPGQGRPGQGQPGEGPQFVRPAPPPIQAALDVDGDGELSSEEIAGAVAALKKLDKNGDGKLDREELRPPRPEGGFAGRPGFGGNPEQFVEQFMAQDKNGDGKVSKDELPEDRQRVLQFADEDGDGAISKEEATKMMARFRQGGGAGRPDGAGRPGGAGRPDGEGRPGAEGGRRPARPESE